MLTLRKICLNEYFEVIGDMFDVDKITTEQHFEDSKNLVIELSQTLVNELTNLIATANVDTTSNPLKLEPMDFGDEYDDEYDDECENEWKLCEGGEEDIKEDVDETETETNSTISELGYKGQIDSDPDFESENVSTVIRVIKTLFRSRRIRKRRVNGRLDNRKGLLSIL